MTRFSLADQTRQTHQRRQLAAGKKTKEETKKVTVTTAPCQNSYIFPLGLTGTKGVFLEKKKKIGGGKKRRGKKVGEC